MTQLMQQDSSLHNLHIPGNPLILVNVWDAGSAAIVEQAGAKAVATGSWAVAHAHGESDGEQLSLDLALANIQRIRRSVSIPVTMDLEGGYGAKPESVYQTVLRALDHDIAGINLEDQLLKEQQLYSIQAQADRINAVRRAADFKCQQLFINARTDIFFQTSAEMHTAEHIEFALERAEAYAEAGADGLFVPGLNDLQLIELLCRRSPLPINIMASIDSNDYQSLADCGVARISSGPLPYMQLMDNLKTMAQLAYSSIH